MLRLIIGKAGKSALLADLCRGSQSGSVCWIDCRYSTKDSIVIPPPLPANVDSYVAHVPNDLNENTLRERLKDLFKELKNKNRDMYADIYLYGNFSINELDVLLEVNDWLGHITSDHIVRLNCTIQTNDEDLIVKVIS